MPYQIRLRHPRGVTTLQIDPETTYEELQVMVFSSTEIPLDAQERELLPIRILTDETDSWKLKSEIRLSTESPSLEHHFQSARKAFLDTDNKGRTDNRYGTSIIRSPNQVACTLLHRRQPFSRQTIPSSTSHLANKCLRNSSNTEINDFDRDAYSHTCAIGTTNDNPKSIRYLSWNGTCFRCFHHRRVSRTRGTRRRTWNRLFTSCRTE